MKAPLISAQDLSVVLGQVTVLDVRYSTAGPPGEQAFLAGHVPGAVFVDLDVALAGTPGRRGRHPLPELEAFEAAMRAAGVSSRRPVIVMDDWGGRAAARAWWLLGHHGHPHVRVLDGGLAAWRENGGQLVEGASTVTPGDFTAALGRWPVVAAAQVLDVAVLVDARAPERFRGEVEPIDPVGGHVPGAVNVPTDANLDGSGRFRSPAELAAVYAAVGVPTERDAHAVAVYCGSGVTAAHDLLALATIGVSAALYPGSWSEWVADSSRPVATGP